MTEYMAKEKEIKTNAMRILDRMKIPYTHYTYECDEFIDGMQIVEKLNLKPEQVYKTLVTQGHSKAYFVFVIPVAEELDLKKAAKAVGEKSLEMIHVKDINQITGYIRGGCTAVGMKKQYKTVIDASAQTLQTMIVSGGRIGSQIELTPGGPCKGSECGICGDYRLTRKWVSVIILDGEVRVLWTRTRFQKKK